MEPTDTCGETITADSSISGTWTAGCQSQEAGRGYARYYSFTLDKTSAVTIELESSVDTYLYLREREARSGTALYSNDDVEVRVNLNSQISEMLSAGTYTIEAITYAADLAGPFTLTVSGLDGDDGEEMEPGQRETDQCDPATITAAGITNGVWTSDCQSQVAERGYAVTLDQQAEVTIELISSVDTYLYLRAGDAQSGDFLHENDDIASGGVNLNSRIVQTLAAGNYTTEATTYSPDMAGSFTLTISGLEG